MKNKYIMSFCSVFFLLSVVLLLTLRFETNHQKDGESKVYDRPLTEAPYEEQPLAGIDADFKLNDNFFTYLPLIILDTAGIEPPISTERQEFKGEWIFMDIEGVEPYLEGTITLIAQNGANHIGDTPQFHGNMMIKRRGNTSMLYDKGQYLMKLLTEKGEENKADLLNMGADNEWILNGSTADESLIRNYLAYRMISSIMPYTPEYCYCEVIEKKSDGYYYKGLYLLGENIKRSEDRVAISKFQSNSYFNSFIVRRDRYNPTDNMLDTYAVRQGITNNYFGLIYPGKTQANKEIIEYAGQQISTVEEILYSEDYDVFSRYSDYIDVDSFVDYFVVNEFFASYDSGSFSTYLYQEKGGKLKIGPVWDFDGTMDNYIKEPLNTMVTAFQTKPWFDRLMSDKTFIKKVEKRYIELRRDQLSNQTLNDTIDEILCHIGGAREREWYRWKHVYTGANKFSLNAYVDNEGDLVERNSEEYFNEIYKIKNSLKKHGNQIYKHLITLEKSAIWATGINNRNDLALFFMLAVLCVSLLYIRRT